METIVQFRLPDGSTYRLVDWVDKPVFSTVDLASGFTDSKISLFTYSAGEDVALTDNFTAGRTADEEDTNVDVGGSNASTEELLVYAIKPEWFELEVADGNSPDATTIAIRSPGQPAPSAANLWILAHKLMVRLKISQKGYAEAGLAYFNTGFGPTAQSVYTPRSAAAAGRTQATLGQTTQEAVRQFAVPHHIGGTEKYQLTLHNYGGNTVSFVNEDATQAADSALVMRGRFYLDGMRKRPTA